MRGGRGGDGEGQPLAKGASNKQNEMRQATISNYKFATAFNPFLLFAKAVGGNTGEGGQGQRIRGYSGHTRTYVDNFHLGHNTHTHSH